MTVERMLGKPYHMPLPRKWRPTLAGKKDFVPFSQQPRGRPSPRGNAEDLRSRSIVGDRFLLDRIDVSGNHTSVDVEPQLALVHSANAAQTNLALADLAVAGARRAHDFVRALDRLPELGDFPHRSARWLTDIEDFLL